MRNEPLVSNYDVLTEYSLKIYLTQCLPFAHKMNPVFQKDIYENVISMLECNFQSAPVKLENRSLVKALVFCQYICRYKLACS